MPQDINKLVKDPEALQILRDLFPRPTPVPPEIDDKGNVLKPGYAPSPLKPAPLVLGGSTLANTVDRVLKAVPGLGGSYKSIQEGPTPEVFTDIASSGLPDRTLSMQGTNLLGATTNDPTHRISINPDNPYSGITVAHELSHSKGFDEAEARIAELLYGRGMGLNEPSVIQNRFAKAPTSLLTNLLRVLKQNDQQK
jgi:hypothetical protein